MTWFFSLFFGVIALCALLWLGLALRDRLAPKTECGAVVEKRYAESFPMTMGFVKRDRKELHLVFITEGGDALDLIVSEGLYKLCPAGTKGRLVRQGNRLLHFDVTTFPEKQSCATIEPGDPGPTAAPEKGS